MPLTRKFTLADLRAARRRERPPVPMLTCYDFTSARLMHEAGVPAILVGDSAANTMLGYQTTLPITLDELISMGAAVRRGAPQALVAVDLPFGSYHQGVAQGVENVCRVMQLCGCDCVKLETAASQLPLVKTLADAGVPVIAHLGLRPQSVHLLGGYRSQGRTALEAQSLVSLALEMERAGAAALLLEAVPPQVARAVIEATGLPVIGCGAGDACHGHVVVMHDLLGLTPKPPRFVPVMADLANAMKVAFAAYVEQVSQRQYPSASHAYEMPAEELKSLLQHSPSQRELSQLMPNNGINTKKESL